MAADCHTRILQGTQMVCIQRSGLPDPSGQNKKPGPQASGNKCWQGDVMIRKIAVIEGDGEPARIGGRSDPVQNPLKLANGQPVGGFAWFKRAFRCSYAVKVDTDGFCHERSFFSRA